MHYVHHLTSADDSQISRMAQLYQEGFSAPPWNESWSLQEAAQELRNTLASSLCLYVSINETLAGFGIACPMAEYDGSRELQALGVTQNSLYIKELVTSAAFRKQGVCSAICRAFEMYANERGFQELVLRTRVDNCALFGVVDALEMSACARYQAMTGSVRSERCVFKKSL